MLAAGDSLRPLFTMVESPITRLCGLEADDRGSLETDISG